MLKHITFLHVLAIVVFLIAVSDLFTQMREIDVAKIIESAQPYEPSLKEGSLVYYQGTLSATTTMSEEFLLHDQYIYIKRHSQYFGYVQTSRFLNNVQLTPMFTEPNDKDTVIERHSAYMILNYRSLLYMHKLGFPYSYTYISSPESMRLDDFYVNDTLAIETNYLILEPSINVRALDYLTVYDETILFLSMEGNSTLTSPSFNDTRITYKVVENETEGIFVGVIQDGTLTPYRVTNYFALNHFFPHATTLEEVIAMAQITVTPPPSYFHYVFSVLMILTILIFLPYSDFVRKTTSLIFVGIVGAFVYYWMIIGLKTISDSFVITMGFLLMTYAALFYYSLLKSKELALLKSIRAQRLKEKQIETSLAEQKNQELQ